MPNAAVTPATASSNSERWISMRVVSAQACPACTQTPTALGMIFAGFTSSVTMRADFPPSSRKVRFMVSAPWRTNS
jgi:hypothetical protein